MVLLSSLHFLRLFSSLSLLLLLPLSSLSSSPPQCTPGDLGKGQCSSPGEAGSLVEGAGPGLEDVARVDMDSNELLGVINHLAQFSDDEDPSVTRIVFTDNDVKGRKYIKELMKELELSIREDAVGNIFGRWEGSEPGLGAILTGSHTDAIPNAGRYDGVLGVVGGLSAVRALKNAGFKPRRSLEVLMFTSEEPTRFGYGCMGSRLMANQPGFAAKLMSALDKWNMTFAEAAAHAGYTGLLAGDRAQWESVVVEQGRYHAFVELHIEQGKVLEDEGIPIGVVSHIAAPAALSVDLSGGGGHAGGLLMPLRNDAGLAAAELALAVEGAALSTKSIDTVATTGHVTLYPNAVNSVPSQAHLEIDVRDIDGERRDEVVAKIEVAAKSIAEKRNVKLEKFTIINADPPATCSTLVTGAIAKSAEELGLKHKSLVSRAYHDSLFMARIAPTGMIFIPCLKGVSHRPHEYAAEEDMRNGVRVLALTLAKLSLQD